MDHHSFEAGGKKISLRGSSKQRSVNDIVNEARKDREKAKEHKLQTTAIVLIQRNFRKYVQKKLFKDFERKEFDQILVNSKCKLTFNFFFPASNSKYILMLMKMIKIVNNQTLRVLSTKLCYFYGEMDLKRFLLLAKLFALTLSKKDQTFFNNISSSLESNTGDKKSKDIHCTLIQAQKIANISIRTIIALIQGTNPIHSVYFLVEENKATSLLMNLLYNLTDASRYKDAETFYEFCRSIVISKIPERSIFHLLRLSFDLVLKYPDLSSKSSEALLFSITKRIFGSATNNIERMNRMMHHFTITILCQLMSVYEKLFHKSSSMKNILINDQHSAISILNASLQYIRNGGDVDKSRNLLSNLIPMMHYIFKKNEMKIDSEVTGMYFNCVSSLLDHIYTLTTVKPKSTKREEIDDSDEIMSDIDHDDENDSESSLLNHKYLEKIYNKEMIQLMFKLIKSYMKYPSEQTSQMNAAYFNTNNPFETETKVVVQGGDLFESFCTFLYKLSNLDADKSEMLNTLCYHIPNDDFLITIWKYIYHHQSRWRNKQEIPTIFVTLIHLFAKCYIQILTVLDDDEFYVKQKPFKIEDNITISRLLKDVVFYMYWKNKIDVDISLRKDLTKLLVMLFTRDSRRTFCANKDHWLVEETRNLVDISFLNGSSFAKFDGDDDYEETDPNEGMHSVVNNGRRLRISGIYSLNPTRGTTTTSSTGKTAGSSISSASNMIENRQLLITQMLKDIPFIFPFDMRVKIFQHFIDQDQSDIPQNWMPPFTVRRNFLFEDGFMHMYKMTRSELKQPLHVQFKNVETGMIEEGVGQGVFKEFLTLLSKEAFTNEYGLFKYTPENFLYPNPSSYLATEDHLSQFEFLGKVLGKALYEKILVDVRFAKFFIAKLLGKNNYFSDLPSLDPELYKHLNFLKNYNGDIQDLSLTFSVMINEFGEEREVSIIKNGKNIPVTNDNKFAYILAMAHYKLNVQIRKQSEAFLKGLKCLIPQSWMTLFDENELLLLICGAEKDIDFVDLRKNCVYSDGYSEQHPTIIMLWKILNSELNQTQKRQFLKFVTSSSRPPILGFKGLQPKFCIKKMGDAANTQNLPRASTCFNILYLPTYNDYETFKKKLLTAIEQTVTFEMT